MKKIFLLTISVLLLSVTQVYAYSSKDEYTKKFQAIFDIIDKNYVQAPDKEKMLEAALNGMASSLDPHSNYYSKEECADLDEHLEGEFGGVGIEVIYENNVIKIISPIDDLPAQKAGIKPGDLIIAVNDELISNLGFVKAVKNMRGKPGTKVHLTIVREGENQPLELDLIREIVKVKSVKYELDDNIAYIRIAAFNKPTADELKNIFEKIKASDVSIAGIILDMRNNPGGFLNQAVNVTNFFIDEGVIVSTKGRTADSTMVMKATKSGPKAPKVPIVVIINSGTASAPEIVAGALQDHNRAIIMGVKSFGKGSVQTRMGALKITTAKYYTPSGRSIQADGILPDIIVEQAKVEYIAGQKEEKRYSEASLKNHLKNDGPPPVVKNNMLVSQPLNEMYKKDYQYSRAFDLLKGLIISKKSAKDNAK